MYTEHHQNCPFCKLVIKKPQHFIEENEDYFSMANISPYSEGHVLIITKEPRTNVIELTKKEWDNLLPILKSTINKIENTFRPQGFNLVISTGKEGGSRQTVFHFHLHVIPEHKGSCGAIYLKRPRYTPTSQEYEEIEKSFQTQQGIVGENDKAVVKLANREQASDRGHLIITRKNPIKSDDINQLDTETWVQMGELLRESIKKIAEQLDASSLRVCLFLGKIGGLNSQDNSQLQIHLVPRYKNQVYEEGGNIPIPNEVVLVAETLKKADSQPRTNISNYANLMVSGGFIATSLVFVAFCSWLKR